MILISLILIVLIFRVMAYISEDFLTPALVKISEYLKLPNILASVTLLAFANGAGDVITSITST